MAVPKTNSISPQHSDLVNSIFEQQKVGLNVDFLLESGNKRISVHLLVLKELIVSQAIYEVQNVT